MMLPRPFPADIKPRSEMKAACVRDEWGKMLEMLDGEEQWREVPEGLIWKDEMEVLVGGGE